MVHRSRRTPERRTRQVGRACARHSVRPLPTHPPTHLSLTTYPPPFLLLLSTHSPAHPPTHPGFICLGCTIRCDTPNSFVCCCVGWVLACSFLLWKQLYLF